nr:hypothetical protein [Actinomycetota bacterium]
GEPLPAAFRRSALPALERALAENRPLASALDELDVRTVPVAAWQLANVNVVQDLELVEQRERALSAAVEAAARHGLESPSPRILADWNDTIVHLAPHAVVARVATSWVAWDKEATYRREIAVAAHASARGGPLVRPSALLAPGPHRARGHVLAFWELLTPEAEAEVEAAEAGRALRAFHEAVADFDEPLPRLDARLERATAAAKALRNVERPDRALLASMVARGRKALRRAGTRHVLHGGPHLSNLLPTAEGPRWIDFDTVCRGPLEWDVAHLPPDAAAAFPEVDPELLAVCRPLVSAEVATWCWHSFGRAPEVDEAARFHLERVRELAG